MARNENMAAWSVPVLIVALIAVVVLTYTGALPCGEIGPVEALVVQQPGCPLVPAQSRLSHTEHVLRGKGANTTRSALTASDGAEDGSDGPPATLNVRVVVTDASGGEFRQEDGQISILLSMNGVEVHRELDVSMGRVSIPAASTGWILTYYGILGGSYAAGPSIIRFDEQSIQFDMEIKLVRPKPTRITITESDTGLASRGIEVVAGGEFVYADQTIPSSAMIYAGTIVHDASSPHVLSTKELQGASKADVLFVRGRGLAWARIPYDPTLGGDVSLELGPAGDIEVITTGESPLSGAWIQLYRAGESVPMCESLADGAGVTRFVGVPAQEVLVMVRSAHWYDPGEILGHWQGALAARQSLAVSIVLGKENRCNGTLRGTVSIPIDWAVDRPSLTAVPFMNDDSGRNLTQELRSSSRFDPSSGHSMDFEWDLGRVRCGRYRIYVNECAFAADVDVGESSSPIAIIVPEVSHLSISVVLDTGQAVPCKSIGWQQWDGVFGRAKPLLLSPPECEQGFGRMRVPVGLANVFALPVDSTLIVSPQLVKVVPDGRGVQLVATSQAVR